MYLMDPCISNSGKEFCVDGIAAMPCFHLSDLLGKRCHYLLN